MGGCALGSVEGVVGVAARSAACDGYVTSKQIRGGPYSKGPRANECACTHRGTQRGFKNVAFHFLTPIGPNTLAGKGGLKGFEQKTKCLLGGWFRKPKIPCYPKYKTIKKPLAF